MYVDYNLTNSRQVKCMKPLYKKIIFFILILLSVSCASGKTTTIISPYWEIPDPDLKEIAMIRADPNWGTVVIYNPITCKEISDACMFFRRHAYAHEHLRHGLLGEPDDYPLSDEASADCWAARYGKPEEIQSVHALLLDPNRNPALRIHGDPIQRAKRIRDCAIEAGKWTGNLSH